MYNLYSCVWEITLACCFSCKYCGSRAGKARDHELSTEECLDVARQLADLGCRRVSLIGGEVFMRADWREIVNALTSRGIRVCIITNGFTFSEAFVADLKSLQIESVAVSIDGPMEYHDRYRQPGSYVRAMNAIKALAQGGIPVSVISTLNADNVMQLETLFEALKQERIWAWQLQACSPMGNAKQNVDYRFDFEQVMDFVSTHQAEAPFPMGIADNIGYYAEQESNLRGAPGACFLGCSAGLQTIGIDSIGNVRGCESMYDDCFIEGNLRERSLRDIWEDENAFSYNRKLQMEWFTGSCKHCDKLMDCGAGCRSYNYFVHGKMYESPFCVRGKKS